TAAMSSARVGVEVEVGVGSGEPGMPTHPESASAVSSVAMERALNLTPSVSRRNLDAVRGDRPHPGASVADCRRRTEQCATNATKVSLLGERLHRLDVLLDRRHGLELVLEEGVHEVDDTGLGALDRCGAGLAGRLGLEGARERLDGLDDL